MRILSRYILREVLSHAVIGGAVFTFVLFMRDVTRILELVVRSSAPIPSVAELIFLTIPSALTVTIPMAVLVGILIGLSRLAADSEDYRLAGDSYLDPGDPEQRLHRATLGSRPGRFAKST